MNSRLLQRLSDLLVGCTQFLDIISLKHGEVCIRPPGHCYIHPEDFKHLLKKKKMRKIKYNFFLNFKASSYKMYPI